MKKVLIILVALGAGAALFSLRQPAGSGGPGTARPQLMVFCAAGLKQPVAAIARQYGEEFGVEVQLQYGGTGTLLSQIRVAKRGDLFIAADDGSVADARKHDAVREVIPLVRQYPVIAVREGNPKGIQSLDDLLREDVKVAVANPEAASVGKSTRAALGDRWAAFQPRIAVMKPTVTELAADLSLGSVDAAVIWNSTVPQFKGLAAVRIPEFSNRVENVSVTVLTACQQSVAALQFARYLAAPEKGGAIFQAQGFEPAAGDRWTVKPELILFSGGVNRPAIEKLLHEFADREGATLTTVFNGCGILCATMKTMGDANNPKFPDAYYACDLCFIPPVANHFPEAVLLTETDIGIVVRKGNPRNVKTMADLAQPGLRVGLCNAEQSTLGYMTKGMLKASALFEGIRKNVAVEVPTADFLINQMRAGGLDAAIVYRVNFQLQEQHLEYLPIKHAGAKAVQPYSIRRDSPNRQLGGRLLEHLRRNRERFTETGFIWRGDEPAIRSKDIEVPPWLKPSAMK